MSLRLLEVMVPNQKVHDVRELVADFDVMGMWTAALDEETALVRLLLLQTGTEELSDAIVNRFEHANGFRILYYAIEATFPQPDLTEEPEPEVEEAEAEELKLRLGRVSRDELYANVAPGAAFSATYLITVFLSALVAAIGLLFDDVAIIIGAMVIAPLLRPNVALALSVTLGDLELMRDAIRTSAAGIVLAFMLATLIGFLFAFDPESGQIAARTSLRLGHVVLALAAGVAGALAFTTGVSATLIGVMVAVALLPPLVAAGLLFGAGEWEAAGEAFVLFLTNVTGVNLASVVTFLAQGIQPRHWWEAKKAKRATRFAISFWVILLFAFLALTLWLRSQR